MSIVELNPQTSSVGISPPDHNAPTSNQIETSFKIDTSVGISDVRPYREPLRLPGIGTIWYDLLSMTNGTSYRVKSSSPEHQTTEITMGYTTPWLTSDKGHNIRPLLNYTSAGIPTREFGPPLFDVPLNPVKFWQKAGKLSRMALDITLAQDVFNYSLISDYLDQQQKYYVTPGLSVGYGESRAAMELLIAAALEPYTNKEVLYAEVVDPCIEHKPDLGELVKPEAFNEPLALIKTAMHIALESRGKHYGSTIDLSPGYIIPALGTGKALFSGETGDTLDKIPEFAMMCITFFINSIANQHKDYEKALSGHKNIFYEYYEGAHMTLAEREIVLRALTRTVIFISEYEKTHDAKQVDLEKVKFIGDGKISRKKIKQKLQKVPPESELLLAS